MNFIKKLIKHIVNSIFNTIKDIFNNFESVSILTLSAIGLTTLLTQIPFSYTLPLWIETPLIIPVISVLIILGLISLMSWRVKCI